MLPTATTVPHPMGNGFRRLRIRSAERRRVAPTNSVAVPWAMTAPSEPLIEDDRTGMTRPVIARAFVDNLVSLQGKSKITATPRDRFFALAYTVRDRLFHRWIATHQAAYVADARRVYYLSAEYLVGRSLATNLYNLGLWEEARLAMADEGYDLRDLLEEEVDAGLGNGGLGRLAACFLDSLATLGIPAVGYGLRYEFGIFQQVMQQGHQVEVPDEWLRFGNPWEIPRPEYAVTVRFGGQTEAVPDGHGGFRVRWHAEEHVIGIPYDTPVAGFQNDVVNTMRLWRARAANELDLSTFNAGDYIRATLAKNASETISKVLYPNDHSPQGKELRLRQQYFFVACSVADILRRYQYTNRGFDNLPEKVALQLNDTHPTIAIVELMRVLVDHHHVPWEKAWDLTVRSSSRSTAGSCRRWTATSSGASCPSSRRARSNRCAWATWRSWAATR
jgi:starch phosphorylase